MKSISFPIVSDAPIAEDEPLSYVPHAGFATWARDKRAEAQILGPMPVYSAEPVATQAPAGVPPYLASLYNVPLLSREQEAHLFRKLNYLKYKATLVQRTLARRPTKAATARLEGLLGEIVAVKNLIISANLRLVVSIAKRHVGPAHGFFELISDGNLSLMRAVERFDFSLGNKFSTYATWAIVNNFARSIPESLRFRTRFRTDCAEVFGSTVDGRSDPREEEAVQQRREILLDGIMRRLDKREQEVIACRYGLGRTRKRMTLKQLGGRLGVSKERVRQLEARALKKLRKALLRDRLLRPDQVEAT